MISESLTSIFDNTFLFMVPAVLLGIIIVLGGLIGVEYAKIAESRFWRRLAARVVVIGAVLLFLAVCMIPFKIFGLPPVLELLQSFGK